MCLNSVYFKKNKMKKKFAFFIILITINLSGKVFYGQDISEEFEKSKYFYEKALKKYQDQLTANPDSEILHLKLGEMYEYKSENELAIKEYEKVLEINQFNVKAKYELGRLYLRDYYDPEEGLKLLQDLAKYLEAKGKSGTPEIDVFNLYILLGNAYEEEELYNDALESYKKAVAINARDPKVHYYLANCYFYGKNQKDLAEAEYKNSITLFPGNITPYLKLGELFSGLEKYEQALSMLKAAQQIDPSNAKVFSYLGYIYLQLKDTDKAQVSFNKAFQLGIEDDYTFYNLGKIYYEKGMYRNAVFPLKRAFDLKPKSYEYQKILAQCYLKERDYHNLRLLFKKVEPTYLLSLGILLFLPGLVMGIIYLQGKKAVLSLSNNLEARIIRYDYFRRSELSLISLSVLAMVFCLILQIDHLLYLLGLPNVIVSWLYLILMNLLMLSVYFKYDRIARRITATLIEYHRFCILYNVVIFFPIIVFIILPYSQIVAKYGPLIILFLSFVYMIFLGSIIKIVTRGRSLNSAEMKMEHRQDDKDFKEVRDIIVVNTGKLKMPNAMAIGILPQRKYIIVFSSLLECLSPEELRSIIYHELAHIKYGHPMRRFGVSALVLLASQLLLIGLPANTYISYFWYWVYLLMFIFSIPAMNKSQEKQADLFAAEKAGAENTIKALQKIHNEAYLPIYFRSRSHPSLYERIVNIRENTKEEQNTAVLLKVESS